MYCRVKIFVKLKYSTNPSEFHEWFKKNKWKIQLYLTNKLSQVIFSRIKLWKKAVTLHHGNPDKDNFAYLNPPLSYGFLCVFSLDDICLLNIWLPPNHNSWPVTPSTHWNQWFWILQYKMVVVKAELDHVSGALTSKIATAFALFCDLTNFSAFWQNKTKHKKIKISDFLKNVFELKISSNWSIQ